MFNQLISIVLLLLCLLMPGCAGVTRVPERARTPQGSEKKIDLSFMQAGKTTRAEVAEKLKQVDTGLQSDHFFLARWNESKWGGWAYTLDRGGAARFWHDVNLLVEFDDKGAVKRSETFPDKLLIEKLTPVAAEDRKSLAENTEMDIQWNKTGHVGANGLLHTAAKLILSADAVEFVEIGEAKKLTHFKVPALQLSNIGTAVTANESDPVYTTQVLHFSSDLKRAGGPRGKKLYVHVTLPELITLLNYLSRHNATAPV